MTPLPLKWRISLLVVVVLTIVITAISAVAYHEMQEHLLANIERTLQAMASGIVAAMDDVQSLEQLEAEVRSIAGSTSRRRSNHYRVWLEGSAVDLLASDPPTSEYGLLLRSVASHKPPRQGQVVFLDMPRQDDEYRSIWTRCSFGDGVANVLIAHSSHHAYHEMHEFLRLLLVLGGSLILGSGIAALLTVVWGLRPVQRIGQKLRLITRHNLGKASLEDINAPSELRPFVTALSKMIARLDKAMHRQRQFTADASHELRTPLALAKSTLQAVRTKDRSIEEYRSAIDDALDDIDRIERLTKQLLTLSRMDEGGEAPDWTEISLSGLLQDLVETFDARGSSAGGRVVSESLPDVRVRGDEDALRQLFSNILDNAVRHGPAVGTVGVSMTSDRQAGARVCVHDEGGKIPDEALPRLFDRFYRVDSSRAQATGGTGLGLAIAKQIALQHGGYIEIESAPDIGTRVSVHLPLAG